jgi:Na+/H+ antiporter NhaD/arsenite permease-like protein
MTPPEPRAGLHGPACWLLSTLGGLALGAILAFSLPPAHDELPLWLLAPFALLLASIALMPFIHAGFWHRHYPGFAFALAGVVAAYYVLAIPSRPDGSHGGAHELLHTLGEYYAFIALVGGLFIVSGAILVDVRGRGTPATNAALLLAGSLLANIVGTTGASMLLIRPFMRVNRGRLHPMHLVFFIFIVSNCAGCLTPIGDPPLYLGFLKGVPFFWTLEHLWPDWVITIALLLAAFLAFDLHIGMGRAQTFSPLPTAEEAVELMEQEIHASRGLRIQGTAGALCLIVMVAGVFVDPLLSRYAGISGLPIGATLQIAVAILAYRLAPRHILAANDFSFGPVKEVGLLFLGIFVTMMPALAYLSAHGANLGITSPTHFYFATGVLSALLDNAPTYANFLQLALGAQEINPDTIRGFLATPHGHATLAAISTGAVFFGGMTYIGNGPNFMVKAIADRSGVAMPSFFGYLGRACLVLLPIILIHWAIFIRGR